MGFFIMTYIFSMRHHSGSQFLSLGLLLSLLLGTASLNAQVTNRSGQDSTIYISNKVFVPKFTYPSGEQNWSIAVADMNHDGKPDIISASKLDGMINIHYNDGRGQFERKSAFQGLKHNRALTVFDANQDGWQDVAVVSMMGKLAIMLNDGQGRLRQTQVFQIGTMAHDISAADLNQDGHLDLVAAIVSLNTLKIHYGDGKGRFANSVSVPTGRAPRVVKCGDIDGDGSIDLVVGCDDGRVYIHPNLGKQNFAKTKSLRSGAANWGLGLADFNQDGRLDIASASYLDKKLCIHLNQGKMLFAREQVVMSGDHNFDLVIRDFDLDGDLDIVTCSTVDRSMGFHLNDGQGVLGERQAMGSGNWNAAVAAGDFDGDGDEDVVTASINDHMINVHRNISIDPENNLEQDACIFGKVYNGDTKEILPNVPISLQNEEGKSLETQYTSEEGDYRFCPRPHHTYQIVVRAPDLPVHVEEFVMPAEDLEKDIYILRPTTAFVYGKVRDEETNQVLREARLLLTDNQNQVIDSLFTDAKGNYRKELPFGTNYHFHSVQENYYPRDTYFDLEEHHVGKGLRHNIFLKPEKAPEGMCILGVVRDIQTELPVPMAMILVRNAIGIAQKEVQADAEGNYRVCLPFGQYEFSTTAKGYFFHLSEINITDSMYQDGLDYQHDIWLDPLIPGAKIVLENIYYDVDKATLRAESIEELERLLEVMETNPELVVEISGHTDSDGSDEHNETLSHNRAQSVVNFLQEKGVYDARMVARGYGENEPIAPNDNKENKQLNRRTEFKVLRLEEGRE